MAYPIRKRWKKIALPAICVFLFLFTALVVKAQNVQWNVVDGGGGISAGGGNTLWGSVNQAATYVVTDNGANEKYVGYIIQLPTGLSPGLVHSMNGPVG